MFGLDPSLSTVYKAKQFAIWCHERANDTYDGKPYFLHLQKAETKALEFIHLIPEEDRKNVLGGIWNHDNIENCRTTISELAKATNQTIAEISYALANEKGRNRKEKANDKYYKGIRQTKYAVFAKLCDRLANVEYSIEKGVGIRMFELYKKENFDFIIQLVKPDDKAIIFFDWIMKLFMSKRKYRDFIISASPYRSMIKQLDNLFK